MESAQNASVYRVWGPDKVVYGPLDSTALRQWINEGRLSRDHWMLVESSNEWKRAGELPELRALFAAETPTGSAKVVTAAPTKAGFDSRALRRIKLFASFDEPQLESFIHYLELVRCPQFSHIVRQGQRGDAMFLVLEGEVRALTIVAGKETTLTTIASGDWFGEISLLDHGPRSVDVIANKDTILLKLSADAFERLLREAPMLSVPFLLALSRTVVERIRRATKRYEDSVRFIRTAGVIQ